jgi:hypothetical protein
MTNTQLITDMLRQALAQGERPFLTISSSSMTPLLRPGDQVGLEAIAANQLQIGDIITLEQNSHLLTHRFWGWDENGRFRTRGDRPLTFDPPAAPDQLLGRVIVRRRDGRALDFTHSSGQRLHRHLIWLLKIETRLLNLPLPPEKQKRLHIRLIHRLIYTWASFVTDKGQMS